MILLRADLVFHWGFWSRALTFSGRQPTMSIPPPTALVGALARGVLNVKRALGESVGEVEVAEGGIRPALVVALSKCVKSVMFRLMRGVIKTAMDKSRIFQAPYIRYENLGDVRQWFGVRDVGKAYAPGAMAEAAWLIDEECAKANLGIGREALAAAAASITRLGPAEGLVSVSSVDHVDLAECEEGDGGREPCPYFPAPEGGQPPPGWAFAEFFDWRDEAVWGWRRVEAKRVKYVVPSSEWAVAVAEFPWCVQLRGYVKFIKCGGRTYPYVG